ncbi:MAG: translation initiation factor eIF-2B, partial [Candidatus Micrarchaeia archaeon]
MEKWERLVRDIRALKVQGAENVAKAAIDAWVLAKDKKKATAVLQKSRPTEPMMRNALKYLNSGGTPSALKAEISKGLDKIAEYGSRLVPNNSIIYTHCHSSTVEAVLVKAKEKGKKFEVHATETRPDYQGRITAGDLARHKIPVTLFVDSAVLSAMKDADAMLIGSDAITAYGGIVNKIGSHLFAKLASERGVPVYIVSHALKFDPDTRYGHAEKIEERSAGEVWANRPTGVKIFNNVFDFVPSEYITAMITELGIMPYAELLEKVKAAYPWVSK